MHPIRCRAECLVIMHAADWFAQCGAPRRRCTVAKRVIEDDDLARTRATLERYRYFRIVDRLHDFRVAEGLPVSEGTFVRYEFKAAAIKPETGSAASVINRHGSSCTVRLSGRTASLSYVLNDETRVDALSFRQDRVTREPDR